MSLSLAVSHVSKEYERKSILNDCSYSFDEAGIYGLIGPNGGVSPLFYGFAPSWKVLTGEPSAIIPKA